MQRSHNSMLLSQLYAVIIHTYLTYILHVVISRRCDPAWRKWIRAKYSDGDLSDATQCRNTMIHSLDYHLIDIRFSGQIHRVADHSGHWIHVKYTCRASSRSSSSLHLSSTDYKLFIIKLRTSSEIMYTVQSTLSILLHCLYIHCVQKKNSHLCFLA